MKGWILRGGGSDAHDTYDTYDALTPYICIRKIEIGEKPFSGVTSITP